MYWRRTCVRESHVFHLNMNYGRARLIGHVLRVYMSSAGQVLQDNISCGKSCIMGGDMSYERSCPTGHVLQ